MLGLGLDFVGPILVLLQKSPFEWFFSLQLVEVENVPNGMCPISLLCHSMLNPLLTVYHSILNHSGIFDWFYISVADQYVKSIYNKFVIFISKSA